MYGGRGVFSYVRRVFMERSRMEKEEADQESPEEELVLAKLRFVKASDAFEPLGFVKRKPWFSVGCAFLTGFGLTSIRKTASALPLLSLGLQISGVMSDIAAYLRKH